MDDAVGEKKLILFCSNLDIVRSKKEGEENSWVTVQGTATTTTH